MLRLLSFCVCFLITAVSCQPNEESLIITPNAFDPITSNSKTKATLDNPQVALAALVLFLENEVYPFDINQVFGVDKAGFKNWLQQHQINNSMQQFLVPAIMDVNTEYVILKNIRLKSTNKLTSIALAGIADITKPLVNNTDIVILQSENGQNSFEQCQYMACGCVNSSNCSCTSKTINKPDGQPCPTDECSSKEDCSSSGGNSNNFGINEVLAAF